MTNGGPMLNVNPDGPPITNGAQLDRLRRGFHDIDAADQTAHELEALIWFLETWLDTLPAADGILWDDPDDGERG
jgi:hypothetical protein